MKLNYVEPKIYTGGIDISEWPSLTKDQRKEALKKQWFVYFSFRDPETGKQKRQPHIKGGAHVIKQKLLVQDLLVTNKMSSVGRGNFQSMGITEFGLEFLDFIRENENNCLE